MFEFVVIFVVLTVGSFVRLIADLAFRFLAARAQGPAMATGSDRSLNVGTSASTDPVSKFGCIVATYGILVLSLLSALPATLALERAGLTFALLAAGGLIGEIAASNLWAADGSSQTDVSPDAKPPVRLELASRIVLMLVLTLAVNAGISVICMGQDLVDIVPIGPLHTAQTPQLEPVVVIAHRPRDPLADNAPD